MLLIITRGVWKVGNNMNAAGRRLHLLEILKREKTVNITGMAEEFNVSTMTIRRDFKILEEQGLVKTTHGGAILNDSLTMEQSYSVKQKQMVDEKRKIGLAAARIVKPGDSVIIDCGTTPKEVAVGLLNIKNITIFTNSILAANVLMQSRDIELIMIPGTFRQKSMGFIGPMAIDFISSIRVDYVFLGVEGIELKQGVSTPNIDDALTKRALVQVSKKRIVVADASKIGKNTLTTIAPLEQIDTIVTCDNMPPKCAEELKSKGTNLLLV